MNTSRKNSDHVRNTFIFLSAAAALWTSGVKANSTGWVGTGSDSLWTDGADWNSGVPQAGDTASFFGTAGNGNASVDLGGTTQSVGSIIFSGTPAAYTLGVSAGDTFNFNAGTISVGPTYSSGYSTANGGTTQTIAANIVDNTSLDLNDAVAGTQLVINGGISGSGSVIYPGGTSGGENGGSILLTGTNTYTGGTLINATGSANGSTTILIGSNSAFGTKAINFNAGGNYQESLAAYGGNVTVANALTLTYGFSIADATTTPSSYSLTLAGPITFSSGRTLTFNNFGQAAILGNPLSPSTVTLPSTGVVNINALRSVAGAAIVVLNDVIQDPAGGAATIDFGPAGNGSLTPGNLIINGASTYGGTTTFTNQTTGTLAQEIVELGVSSVVNSSAVTATNPSGIVSGAFGTGTVVFTDSEPPIFEPFGADQTVANPLTLSTGFFVASAPTTGTGPTVDPAGTTHNLTFTGSITDAGTVITNNLAAGVGLYLGSATTASTLTISKNAATFQSQTSSGTTYIYDQITGPGSVVVKEGGTVQFLSSSNTYSGTTSITGGTALALNTLSTSSATGAGAVSVTGSGTLGSGGTLGGTGYIAGPVTISSTTAASQGGIISPGVNGIPGTLNVASAVFNPAGRFVFHYNGTSGSAGAGVNDLLLGTGSLDLTNLSSDSQFDLNLNAVVAGSGPTTYTLANFAAGIYSGGTEYPGGTDVSGLFSLSGTVPFSASVQVIQELNGSESLDLIGSSSSTPEPASIALLGAAGLLVSRRLRRPMELGR